MSFRRSDLLDDFDRLAKGPNLGPEFDQTAQGVLTELAAPSAGSSTMNVAVQANGSSCSSISHSNSLAMTRLPLT